MEDFLQTAAQFANDHWLTLSIGFLLVLFYRYVSMIFYNPMRYINCSLVFFSMYTLDHITLPSVC